MHNRKKVNYDNLVKIKFSNTKMLNAALINARSICNKAIQISDFIFEHNIDILCITETWLKSNCSDNLVLSELLPPGYDVLHIPRPCGRRGGGVGLVFKSTLKISMIEKEEFDSFEHMVVKLKCESTSYTIVIVYRPPCSKRNQLTYESFCCEFPSLLENVMIDKSRLLILGDFNIPMDNPEHPKTAKFNDILDTFGLRQHVKSATHNSGHILDLILTREEECISNSIKDKLISDHSAVLFDLQIKKPPLPTKEIAYRKIKSINIESFIQDIKNSQLNDCLSSDKDVNELATMYNTILGTLLEKHAPLKRKTITIHPKAPWYSIEIQAAKKTRRQAERKWNSTGLTIDEDHYRDLNLEVNNMITESKCNFYQSIMKESQSQGILFKCIDELLGKKKVSKYPEHTSPKELSDQMSKFFVNKIKKIRSELEQLRESSNIQDEEEETLLPDKSHHLTIFEETNTEEITKIIQSSASKSCTLDPIPTSLLKDCLEVLAPIITKIINTSLATATVPNCFKVASITPILKKSDLDANILQNYRPISNLPFVSKILEKVVGKRLNSHKDKYGLNEKFQSAYRKFHSTETALVRIQNDILRAIDNKQQGCGFLVLLDLSAAFDTVDHKILIRRMEKRFGVNGLCLDWLSSYLHKRKQFVSINGGKSDEEELDCDVPQGSVLGPTCFGDYNSPIGAIFRRHNIEYHLYADDTQVYVFFKPGTSEEEAVKRLEACLADVRLWMAKNYLKLNDKKTDFLIFCKPAAENKIQTKSIKIGNCDITPSSCVTNIGATFDKHMKLNMQINKSCRSAWFSLYTISKIKKYLTTDQKKSAVHAYVTSKIDSNNSLYIGLPKTTLLNKLSRVQHASARFITSTPKQPDALPMLKALHWLPIEERVEFKVLLLAFKALIGEGPSYIKELIPPKTSKKMLRSSSANELAEERSYSTGYGDRAFSIAAPKLWNQLPRAIRDCKTVVSFKSKLKTHFFQLVFKHIK